MRKILILVFSLFSIFSTVEAKSKKGQDRVLIDKVAMWQVNHQSKVKHHDLAWTNGVLFRGMVEWADYTQDSRYYDFLTSLGVLKTSLSCGRSCYSTDVYSYV